MFLGKKINNEVTVKLQENVLKNQNEVKLLGVNIDNKLKFSNHISQVCKTANNKLSALFRLRKYLNEKQTRILKNSHVLSSFYYCPIIWMFCSKTDYNKIEKTHKRTLRLQTKDFTCDYKKLLKLTNSNTIHQKHIQFLLTEIYKTKNKINPEFMKEIFLFKETKYNLRKKDLLQTTNMKTTTFGINTFTFEGCLIWNSLENCLKEQKSLEKFKNLLKQNKKLACNCKICQ